MDTGSNQTPRWKCPDCSGWVDANLAVHYCGDRAPDRSFRPYWPIPFRDTTGVYPHSPFSVNC